MLLSSPMNRDSSAIASGRRALSTEIGKTGGGSRAGMAFGLLGVLAFSFTLPFTRVAVAELSPLFIGAGRAVAAALLGAIVLAVVRPRLPRGRQWLRLAVVGLGVVAGFSLLTSFALQTVPAAHGAVVIGLLPAATAAAAVLRAKERPSRAFWWASAAGVVAVIGFVAISAGGIAALQPADLLLVAAVVSAAIGYAEGAMLSRELGSWQTICWALLVSLPVMVPLTVVGAASMIEANHRWPEVGLQAWLAFAYLATVSMFLGFFAWYRGLAIGPISRVSQIQLVQPVFTIVWSALLLHEHLDWTVWAGAAVVVLCAATAVRSRVRM